MRAVASRVKSASVSVSGAVTGSIGKGLLVFLGMSKSDTEAHALKLADRVCKMRVFEDADGKMNLSPSGAGAELLIVSNFTLYADCLSSRRPDFGAAARPDTALPLYEKFVSLCRDTGLRTETGVFGAEMEVLSAGDGPVNFIIEV